MSTATQTARIHFTPNAKAGDSLEARLRREVDGEVMFDAPSRGRYATDASIYQIMPIGVVVPRTMNAAITALQIAAEEGVAHNWWRFRANLVAHSAHNWWRFYI